MKQVKFMTNDQIKRIQDNNYCSEHDRNGKQFDYEAKGYREAIDQRLWELNAKNVDNMIKRGSGRVTKAEADKPLEKAVIVSSDQLNADLIQLDLQLSVMRAFNMWRYIGNELMIKYGIDK